MIILASIQLPDGLIWRDRHAARSVAQTARIALDGSPVIYHAPLTAGRPITLESQSDAGWLPRATVEAIEVLARIPGALYAFEFHGEHFEVMFRHHDAPAFDAQPLIPGKPRADDWFFVQIKLITV